MPKLRVIIKPPPEPTGDAERDVEAQRDYLLQMSEELAYVLTHLEADNIGDSTFERIQGMIPKASVTAPPMDGAGSPGGSATWARGDHQHPADTNKADVTALEETAGDLADHVDDTGNPHEVTAAQVGLGNVDNVRQYSAQNPPPLPTPADIGAATAQDLTDHVGDTNNPHGVTAAQAGARPDTWTPTASDVGARPDDWVPDAEDVPYDNTGSGLMATDVQSAIDEIAQGGGGGGTAASAVSYDNTGSGLTATNVQDAIDEVYGDIPAQASDIGAQPTITASGILKGDGQGGVSAAEAGTDYQAPLTIDPTPTANSTNPVQSGGVYADVRTRVPVYGMGKNLLDNAYFVGGGSQLGDGIFPINQRGQSTYTGGVYGPDRWKGVNNQSVMTLVSNGLQLSTTDSSYRTWQQLCSDETKSLLSGKTGTISVIEDGVLYSATGVFGTRFDAQGAKYTYSVNTSQNEIARIGGGTNGAAVVSAIKVELGTEQTLAHQENGVWVLNEIPDYGKELAKCQRYLLALRAEAGTPVVGNGIAIGGTQALITIPTPVTMRKATPTVTYSGTVKLNHGSVFGNSAPDITSISGPQLSANCVMVGVNVPGGTLTAGEPCGLSLRSNDPFVLISCEP